MGIFILVTWLAHCSTIFKRADYNVASAIIMYIYDVKTSMIPYNL